MTDRRLVLSRIAAAALAVWLLGLPAWAQNPSTTPTPSATPTNTPTCAPTGTPYCARTCVPCPTVAPNCYAVACGFCVLDPGCPAGEVRFNCGAPIPCTSCQCVTPSPTWTPSPTPTGTRLPEITGGAMANSTLVVGRAVPNPTAGNRCITIMCCDPVAGCGHDDHELGRGDVDPQGRFAVMVSPPLEVGKTIYPRDGCTGQTGVPLIIGPSTIVPLLSPRLAVLLAVGLGLVAMWAMKRRRSVRGAA